MGITGLALSQQLPASFIWKWNHSQCPFPCPQQQASTYNSGPTRAHRPLGCQGKANFFVHRAATDGGTALPSVCAGCFLVQVQVISRTHVITVLSSDIKKIWPLIETCLFGMVCAARHHVDTLLPVVVMQSTLVPFSLSIPVDFLCSFWEVELHVTRQVLHSLCSSPLLCM